MLDIHIDPTFDVTVPSYPDHCRLVTSDPKPVPMPSNCSKKYEYGCFGKYRCDPPLSLLTSACVIHRSFYVLLFHSQCEPFPLNWNRINSASYIYDFYRISSMKQTNPRPSFIILYIKFFSSSPRSPVFISFLNCIFNMISVSNSFLKHWRSLGTPAADGNAHSGGHLRGRAKLSSRLSDHADHLLARK